MNERFDVVVIGGGHNGLTTACLMAMKGNRVALVEKRDLSADSLHRSNFRLVSGALASGTEPGTSQNP